MPSPLHLTPFADVRVAKEEAVFLEEDVALRHPGEVGAGGVAGAHGLAGKGVVRRDLVGVDDVLVVPRSVGGEAVGIAAAGRRLEEGGRREERKDGKKKRKKNPHGDKNNSGAFRNCKLK